MGLPAADLLDIDPPGHYISNRCRPPARAVRGAFFDPMPSCAALRVLPLIITVVALAPAAASAGNAADRREPERTASASLGAAGDTSGAAAEDTAGAPAGAEAENGEPEAVRALIAQSEEEYQRGVEAYRNEEIDTALELFDSAVLRLIQAPEDLRRLPAVGDALQDLVDDIHALEIESYQERGRREETPREALKNIEAFLTPAELERQRRQVEGELPQIGSDLPIVVNDQVLGLIEAYQTRLKEQYQAGIRRSGRYVAMMRRIFAEEGLPQDLVYMAQVESTFKVNAYSRARAKGLWQFIASTGRVYGLRNNHWVDERSDPEKATRAAARYLRDLHARFGDWNLAMAGYNAGEGKIERAIRMLKSRDFWRIAQSRLLRRETRNYVPGILASVLILKDPERYGFDAEYDSEVRTETAEVDSATELRVIAECAGVSVEEVRALNPELRRLITPPDRESYAVRLPAGTSERFAAAFAQVPREQRLTFTQHSVRPGETLASIAGRYRTSVDALQRANGLRNRHRLSIGQVLTIPVGASGEVYTTVADADDSPARFERGEKIVHRVRRGETLYRIARRYRTTIESIRRWNAMGSSSLLRPGRRLVVYYRTLYGREPDSARGSQGGGGSIDAGEAGRVMHRVRRGETLSAIARRYEITVESLCRWNSLDAAGVLTPGTELVLLLTR